MPNFSVPSWVPAMAKSSRCFFQWESSQRAGLDASVRAVSRQIQTAPASPCLSIGSAAGQHERPLAPASCCSFVYVRPAAEQGTGWCHGIRSGPGPLLNKNWNTSCWQKSKSIYKLNSSLSSFSKVSTTRCGQESFFISNKQTGCTFIFGIRVILKDHKITNLLEDTWCLCLWIYDESLICWAAHVIYYSCKSYCNGSVLDATFFFFFFCCWFFFFFFLTFLTWRNKCKSLLKMFTLISFLSRLYRTWRFAFGKHWNDTGSAAELSVDVPHRPGQIHPLECHHHIWKHESKENIWTQEMERAGGFSLQTFQCDHFSRCSWFRIQGENGHEILAAPLGCQYFG